ncbi:MAG: glycosyltransferase [Leptolyngbyaceae cyanobacterium SL_5_9]|nr:glycosyltransferase [Leptolyngbyaceae cyanobacterium SL_5_9]NJO72847.1 glycosyltransferase [Leptolyngbyaceae cyanobacterium RM1_406_9]
MNSRTVAIYRDLLLPYSETFIPAQVESLSTYSGFYVGMSRVAGANSLVSQKKSIVLSDLVSQPAPWKLAFKLTGFAHPGWFREIKKRSPQLVHAHFGLDGVLSLPLAKKLNVPLVVTFHGNDATGMEYKSTGRAKLTDLFQKRGQFFRDLYLERRDRLFKSANCFIAVSEFIRSKLVDKGCPSDKILVHYIGVDIDKFTPNLSIQREPIVMFVGRLVEKKGCEYLIRAMAQVQAVMPEIELVVVGSGPLQQRLEQLAQSCLKRYRFLGVQPPEAVKDLMNRSLLLCTPSVTAANGDSEGLPIVVYEAQAMGLPVVGSIHAGIPEAVVHGETGFLAPERDWEMLGKHMVTILNDVQLRERFSMAGRKRAEQEFSLKSNTAKLEAIYDRILSNRL